MSEKREKYIARIKQLWVELKSLNVKPDVEPLSDLTESDLLELGLALREQVETRRKFLNKS